jgi:hypothetical protein
LIEIIKEIKTENPGLQPPDQSELTTGLASGFRDSLFTMYDFRKLHQNDSTVSFPEHNQSNSLGNADNGWTDYWHYTDFFYSDTKEIVHTWARLNADTNSTTIALISLSNVNEPGVRLINRDFWYIQNKKQIYKFKEIILDRINKKIAKRKNL